MCSDCSRRVEGPAQRGAFNSATLTFHSCCRHILLADPTAIERPVSSMRLHRYPGREDESW